MESGTTITIETGLSVDTQLRTSAIIGFTFVTSTLVDRLVLGVGAILNLITYFRQGNAHPIAAIEFRFAVTCSFRCSWRMSKRREKEGKLNCERRFQWSVKWMLTAVQLVTSIPTFSFSWTVEMTGDARFISALILIRTTSDVLTVWHHFVIAPRAILLAVANPTAVNARDSVFAEIFRLNACHWQLSLVDVDRRAVLKKLFECEKNCLQPMLPFAYFPMAFGRFNPKWSSSGNHLLIFKVVKLPPVMNDNWNPKPFLEVGKVFH